MDLNQIVNSLYQTYHSLEPDIAYATICIVCGTGVAYWIERGIYYKRGRYPKHTRKHRQGERVMAEPKTYSGNERVVPQPKEYLSVDGQIGSHKV